MRRRKKDIYIGMLLGFVLSIIMMGAGFYVWQRMNRKEAIVSNPNQVTAQNDMERLAAHYDDQETVTQDSNYILEGTWNRQGDTEFNGSELTITLQEDNLFEFSFDAYNGSHIGMTKGVVGLKNDQAVFQDDEYGYTIEFHIIEDVLSVKTTDFIGVMGIGVTIDGDYKKRVQEKTGTDFIQLGVFSDNSQLEAFKDLVKEDYELFQSVYQLCYQTEDLDGFMAQVFTGGVRGLSAVMEGIIMVGPEHTFWAALIDGDVVRYYTNSSHKDTLPVTIDWWRRDFDHLDVVLAQTEGRVSRLNLEILKSQGFEPMKEHSFFIEYKELGSVEFISGVITEEGKDKQQERDAVVNNKKAEYYLVDQDGNVVYKFPTAKVGDYVRTRAVSFQNLDTLVGENTSENTSENAVKTDIVDNTENTKDTENIENTENTVENTVISKTLNNVDVKDIIIIEEYTNKDKKYGDIPFPYCRIYDYNDFGFTNVTNIYEDININNKNENILMIMENLQAIQQNLNQNENTELVDDLLNVKEGQNNIADLTDQGMTIFSDQIVTIDTKKWGKVRLIPGHHKGIGMYLLRLYLVDDTGMILYQLPELATRDCYNVSDIIYQDMNMDGSKDILIIATYTSGFGTDGITPTPYSNLYLQTEDGFANVEILDKEVNYQLMKEKKSINFANIAEIFQKLEQFAE
ncbi:hypothetical protein I5677_10815 [Mobilitalea sibirica]|uniref:Uncharacterized protein n=1 Tax=Mobilitalea sibirica TaxID=1462919 RepID=A0A8J7H3A1_9FIRM|nr:hypothetical protein [Mobilitalea sibirica]MBH1941384.1 hypothetical protein [Mobilitalea sibirica]